MTARSTPSRRATKLFVVAAAAMVGLTGCGGLHPGVAAVVGSATISREQVDDVARALCSANIKGAEAQGQQAPDLASRGARQSAVQILLDTELSSQFGEQEGVEPSKQQVSQALAQNEQGVALLPESQRASFRETLKGYAEGQLVLIQIGRQSLEDQGKSKVTDDQAIAEGQRLRGRFVKTLDVEVDPRYGSFENDTLQAGGTALSVAASDSARAGEKSDPGASYVSGLPSSQRCS